ncbi:MAG TPA: hypothetical protein IAC04_02580 [Candidatus Coprenecus stercoravium]|uniref:Right handed beta helix domain-containing protein n=1 Tax=Candidatus Coprenecus stercoravium TaxID=2840735 RepID=A0A9D2KAK2_9BACT|nr:hypothetical protein [Candidatus Coprenecus stercoravium]
MKKIIITTISLAALLLTGACSVDEKLSGDNGPEATLTLNLGLEGAVQTKAIGDGTGADRLIYAVFDENGTRIQGIEQVDKNVSFPATETITLAKGQTYRIAFWAQDADCQAYTVSDDMKVTVDYSGAAANDETRDAFFKTVDVTVTGNAELDVELTRPFAQLNVGVYEDDWNAGVASGIVIATSKAVVKQAASTLNLLDGTVSDPVDVTFDFAAIPAEALSVDLDGDGTAETYKYLSMNYILPFDETTGDASTTLSDLEFTFHPEAGNDITLTQGLDAVPVQRNWRTNIIGQLLSGDLQLNISIDSKFNNDNNVEAPTTTVIYNADQLAAALTSDAAQIAVTLGADIDLPISDLGQQTGGSGEYKLGGENTESILIDLNNHTLNLTTSYMSKLGAKNDDAVFTIQNGTMTSSSTGGTWNIYDLTFANCNYKIEDVVFEKSIAFTNDNRTVTMNDVTINEQNGDYYAMWISAVGQNITIDGLTLSSTGRGIKIDEEYVNNPAKVTLNISNSKFTTVSKAAIMVDSKEGAEIHVTNVDIANVAADPIFTVWVDEGAKDYADKVIVNGALVKVEGSADMAVANADELLEAMALLKAESEESVSIYLIDDINLQGTAWTPVHSRRPFVLDGNGHTISNLTTSTIEASSGFPAVSMFSGNNKSAEFRNLNIDKANITGDGSENCCGAVLLAVANTTEVTAVIENVTISNSTVSNCEHSSVFVGYSYWTPVSLKDCTAESCTVNSNGNAGALLGINNTKSFSAENCAVNNCTISNTGIVALLSPRAGIYIGTWQAQTYPEPTLTNCSHQNSKAVNYKTESEDEIGRIVK